MYGRIYQTRVWETLIREDTPMARRYHDREGLTIADLGISLEELRGDPLEFLAREGARLLLMVALEEEVTGFLGCGR